MRSSAAIIDYFAPVIFITLDILLIIKVSGLGTNQSEIKIKQELKQLKTTWFTWSDGEAECRTLDFGAIIFV